MKKGLIILLWVVFFVVLMNFISALSNPSAVYCENLGYTYTSNSTLNGDVGICEVSENIKLNAWDFFEGKIGQQYSYCAKNGYPTKTISDGKNTYSEEYATCGIQNNSNKGLFGFLFSKTEYKSVTDLMNLSEGLEDLTVQPIASSVTESIYLINQTLSSFDWRNYNGFNWISSVKNQGSCGSCWAFATVGGAEAKIKIVRNDSNFDVNLAEQDLVSCGVPYGFYPGEGGCSGATLEDPLNYMNNTGIVDEACFPYTSQDSLCSDRCSSFDKRLWKIDNYGYISPSEESIKEYLITKGPIIVSLYMGRGYWNGSVYMCANPDLSNHAVVIVGYNDTGNYWIVKNSWGSNWNENGYFNVGYQQCNIEETPIYVNLEVNYTERINTNNISVYSGIVEGNYSNFYHKDDLFVNYKCNDSNCSYDIQNAFQFGLSKILSLDAITYQNSSDGKASLNYLNNNSWESLGFISQMPYLVKYNLCGSLLECSNVLSAGNVFLRYFSQNSTSIDLLYLEAEVPCLDNWVLNDSWSSCEANNTQYKNYYDLNQCYQNVSYINRIETQYCDYCTPNWTVNEICNPDNSLTIWYSDFNSCFSKTNLSSDLQGIPDNQTLLNSCSFNGTIIENASAFCGDTSCDSNEDCSSCSSDCGVCLAPAPASPSSSSSGGGGSGGNGNPIMTSVASKPIVNNTNTQTPILNQSSNEPMILKEDKKQFSLTGLIVGIQNNQSLRIALGFVVLFGMITALLLIRKQKFSRKHIHKNMVKIRGKRK